MKSTAGPSPRTSTARLDAVDREALHLAGVAPARGHEVVELPRHRDGPALAVHADEEELGRGDERVVATAVGDLTHGEAGAADVGQVLLESQHVAGEGGGVVLDDRLAHGRPGAGAVEEVHARTGAQHLPPGALEQAQERGLVQVAEGIALVGVRRSEVDGGHGPETGRPDRGAREQ